MGPPGRTRVEDSVSAGGPPVVPAPGVGPPPRGVIGDDGSPARDAATVGGIVAEGGTSAAPAADAGTRDIAAWAGIPGSEVAEGWGSAPTIGPGGSVSDRGGA